MLPEKSITILGIEDGSESMALRSCLEQLSFSVRLIRIGEPNDLICILPQCQNDNLVVLCCHGKDGNILMPELHESIARKQSFITCGPAEVQAHLAIPNIPVICTGCTTGTPEMADAMLSAGSTWYLAPVDYIDGDASFVYVLTVIYLHLNLKMQIEQAALLAVKPDESQYYRLYSRTPDLLER